MHPLPRVHHPEDPAEEPAVRQLGTHLAGLEHAFLDHVRDGEHLNPCVDRVRDHVCGPREAPVALLEFGDYTCPHTRELAPAIDAALERLGDRASFTWRHFPLVAAHPGAALASLAAEAAARQGSFWTLHDRLVHADPGLRGRWILEEADGAGLDLERLLGDVRAGTGARRILADAASGALAGVNGTPVLFIDGRRYDGELDAGELVAALEASLARFTAAAP